MGIDLVQVIAGLVPEVAEEQEVELPEELTADTVLFGREGFLDSLGLVNLILALEEAIDEQLGVTVALADEKAFSQKSSPYRTIGSLAAYAQGVVEQSG